MENHGTVREGIITGALGATGVAVWFLIVDTVAGQPFFTPRVLGEGLQSIVAPEATMSAFAIVALYTVFHYAVFFIAGIVIFSGSLYAMTFTGIRALGAITPLGGACWIAAWVLLASAARKG